MKTCAWSTAVAGTFSVFLCELGISSAADLQCNDKSTPLECYEAGLNQVGVAPAILKVRNL